MKNAKNTRLHVWELALLLAHAGQSGDVADPWYTGDFEATWQDVNIGCRALLKELTEKK